MRLTICAVGRLKAGPERDLIDKYQKRVQWPFEIIEVEERRKLSAAELKSRESCLLLGALPPGAVCIAMDERASLERPKGFTQVTGALAASPHDNGEAYECPNFTGDVSGGLLDHDEVVWAGRLEMHFFSPTRVHGESPVGMPKGTDTRL